MKKKNYIYLLLIIPGLLSAQAGRKKVLKGNEAYAEERYDAAANAYQDALIENPASPVIHYNMGAAQYQKNDYEKALESYQQALNTDDPLLQSKAYYNMGNALYRSQKLQEAIQAYEQALKLSPEDEDAKYNLEFVRNKLKENAQPQQNQPQDQQQQQQNQQQQNQNEQQQDQQQQQNQEKEQQKQQQSPEQRETEKQQNQQQKSRPQERETEMTEEEAEQLLNALKKEDQEDLQKKKAQSVQGRGRVGKDW